MQLTVAGPQFLSVGASEIAVTTKHHDMEMLAKSLIGGSAKGCPLSFSAIKLLYRQLTSFWAELSGPLWP